MTTEVLLGCIWALIALIASVLLANTFFSGLLHYDPLKKGEAKSFLLTSFILTLLLVLAMMAISYGLYAFFAFCVRLLFG